MDNVGIFSLSFIVNEDGIFSMEKLVYFKEKYGVI